MLTRRVWCGDPTALSHVRSLPAVVALCAGRPPLSCGVEDGAGSRPNGWALDGTDISVLRQQGTSTDVRISARHQAGPRRGWTA